MRVERNFVGSFVIGLASVVTLAVFINGCAEDRDVEDYKREQLAEELSEYDQASGVYSGTLVSKKNSKVTAGIQINLEPDTFVVPSAGTGSTDLKPILRCKITLWYGGQATIVFPETYYDVTNGNFRSQADTVDKKLMINGTVEDGIFDGELSFFGFSDWGASFNLSRDDKVPEKHISISQDEADKHGVLARTYVGQMVEVETGIKKPVKLNIIRRSLSFQDQILEFLLPVKKMNIGLSFGEALSLLFEDAEWDGRDNSIIGEMSIQRGGQGSYDKLRFALNCLAIQKVGESSKLLCHYMSTDKGKIANLNLTEVKL